ncbi:MAG: hypothetical protein GY913_12345 [Proteobacteria bacterium]|nr:hypothetical protein [Pseudomonadota bacterium]MCP4917706.1 hypothetical protein [Pseudomonadota bacterium]
MFAWMSLLACRGPVEPSALPSAWSYEHADGETGLDPETAEQLVTELIDSVYAFPARTLFPGYDATVAARSESCVEWNEATVDGLTTVAWNGLRDRCDNPESGVFYGQTHHFYGSQVQSDDLQMVPLDLPGSASEIDADCVLTGDNLTGQGIVQAPTGVRLGMAGAFSELRADCPERTVHINVVAGAWSFDGEPAIGWLGPTGSLDWTVVAEDDGLFRRVEALGAVDVLERTGGTAFTTGLVVDSSCPLEPRGEIAVRGLDGRWAFVVFDDVCDGCGLLGDQPVCVDASHWLGWSEAPW